MCTTNAVVKGIYFYPGVSFVVLQLHIRPTYGLLIKLHWTIIVMKYITTSEILDHMRDTGYNGIALYSAANASSDWFFLIYCWIISERNPRLSYISTTRLSYIFTTYLTHSATTFVHGWRPSRHRLWVARASDRDCHTWIKDYHTCF